MPSPSYDLYQQVFALSMLSNRVSGYTGNTASLLQQQLQLELGSYLSGVPQGEIPGANWPPPTLSPAPSAQMGTWTLEWGPAVFQSADGSQVADNAMFVASCPNVIIPGVANQGPLTVYVVAIAATNFASAYDWTVEDGDVTPIVDFSTYDPSSLTAVTLPIQSDTPYISMATAIGVSTLLTKMPSPTGAVASGQTLQKFLGSIAGAGSAVIFTGHSLAGALSPTLALYLKPSLTTCAEVLVYPTAGATPGETNFATAFNTAFPQTAVGSAGPYQQWNTLLWNFYDVVPHAWNPPVMQEIITLYGNNPTPHWFPTQQPPFLPDIWALVEMALYHSAQAQSGIVYTRLQNNSLNSAQPSSLQPATDFLPGTNGATGVSLTLPPASAEDFVLQLVIQHVYMYIGVDSVSYYPNNSQKLVTLPAVTGLILPTALPKFPTTDLVKGIAIAPNDTILNNILDWIVTAAAKWLINHIPKPSIPHPASALPASPAS